MSWRAPDGTRDRQRTRHLQPGHLRRPDLAADRAPRDRAVGVHRHHARDRSPGSSAAGSTRCSAGSWTCSWRSRSWSSRWRSPWSFPDKAFGLYGDCRCGSACWCSSSGSSTGPTSGASFAARRSRCANVSTSRPPAASAPGVPTSCSPSCCPNLVAPILVYSTLIIPTNILFEAALSFLGVGVPPPTATLGRHARRRGRTSTPAALHVLARPGDLRHGAGLQSLRGRAARRVGSQEPVTHRATSRSPVPGADEKEGMRHAHQA